MPAFSLRRTWTWTAVLALLTSLMVATTAVVGPSADASAIITEQPPDIPFGGRTTAVSIDPENPDHVLAAAEAGGIFVSWDAGSTWAHVDTLPVHRMVDLRFHPTNGAIVIATAVADTRAGAGLGGVWRSADGGATWAKPATANVCPRHAGYGIAWERSGDGTVVVGTDCGVAISRNSGSTWTTVDTAGSYEASVTADVVGAQVVISVCGNDGFQRSTDTGVTWTAPVGVLADAPQCFSAVWSHSLQTSPYDEDILWAAILDVNAAGDAFSGSELWESRDGGATWDEIDTTMTLNRPPFVIAHEAASGVATEVDLWFGDGVRTFRQVCDGVSTATPCPGGGAQVTEDHADQFDIAYPAGSNCARFMASDGGVHRSGDCGGSFTIVGANGGGYNALQIYDLALQAHPDHLDLYFGTQDNALWASPDGGASWPTSVSAEGFFLDVEPLGDGSHGNSLVTGVRCAACSNFRTSAHFGGLATWNDPVVGGGGNPYLLKPNWYAQVADADPSDTDPTLSVYVNTSVDAAASWVRKLDLVDGGGTPYVLRGRAIFAGPAGDRVMYQGYRAAGNTTRLLRIDGLMTSANPSIREINTFGSIAGYCNGQGTFVCPSVFGVNPSNPDHIIVMDGSVNAALESLDGGLTFTQDPGLTSAITGNGALRFADASGGNSQAHVVKWDPANPSRILVGTEEAGIIASYDGGVTWGKVPGSERIVAISDIEFDQVRGDIWVSTYGRGLWTIELPEADLSIGKTHRPEFPVAGEQIFYDLTVTNDGPAATADTLVTDVLPPQVTYVTSTLGPDGSGCAVSDPGDGVTTGQTVVCNVGPLQSGQSVTFTIKGHVAADTVSTAGGPTTITNRATVSTTSATDTDPSDNAVSDNAIIEDRADLEIAKVCDDAVYAGQTATCTITVDNEGPSDARGVIMTDELSSDGGSFTIVGASSDDGTCSVSSNTVTCDFGTLEASSTTATGRASAEVQVRADEGQTIENLATVRSDTPDPNDANDQAIDSIAVTSVADLGLSDLVVVDPPVVAGESTTWRVTASNGGPSQAVNTRVRMLLPAGLTVTGITTSTGGTCAAGTPGDPAAPSTCSLGTMASGANATMTVTASVAPTFTGDLTVSASIASDTLDLQDANNLASLTTAVQTSSNVAVSALRATPSPVVAGTPLTYEATITASGPSTARDVSVEITLPAEVDFQTATVVAPATGTCAGVTESGDTVRCSLGDLAPGAQVVVAIGVDVLSSAGPTTMTATATAASNGTPDPMPGDNTRSVSTQVTTSADVALAFSAPLLYDPSSTVRFTVRVDNAGPSDARGVVATFKLPNSRIGEYRGTNGPCTLSGTTLTCTIGTLVDESGTEFWFDYYVRGNKKRLTVTGEVTATTPDPTTSNNTAVVEMDSK